MRDSLPVLEKDIVSCGRCPRLRAWCEEVARVKRRAWRDWQYWARPVPGFGDPRARLYILGLAPGAHGANRTGRVFTGDRSADWLFRALYESGFASQPTSTHLGDGLVLRDAWIGASARCAPPANRPLPAEFARCREFLIRELNLLGGVRVVVALGRLAFENYLAARACQGPPGRRLVGFAHGALHDLGRPPLLLCSYHPSQQNTSTGRLSRAMLGSIFEQAARLLR